MLKELCSRDNTKRHDALLVVEQKLLSSSECKQNINYFSLLINVLIHDADTNIRLKALQILTQSLPRLSLKQTQVEKIFECAARSYEYDRNANIRECCLKILGYLGSFYGDCRVNWKFPKSSSPEQNWPLSLLIFVIIGMATCDVIIDIRKKSLILLTRLPLPCSQLAHGLLAKRSTEVVHILNEEDLQVPWSFFGNYSIALEDEFQIVREAALYSIKCLSLNDESFAIEAVNVIIDSFQDEATYIRQCAFEALVAVLEKYNLILSIANVETILSHLDDVEVKSRHLARRIYGLIRLNSSIVNESIIIKLVTCVNQAASKFQKEKYQYLDSCCLFARKNANVLTSFMFNISPSDKFYEDCNVNMFEMENLVKSTMKICILECKPEDLTDKITISLQKQYRYLSCLQLPHFPNLLGSSLHSYFYPSIPEYRHSKIDVRERCESILLKRLSGNAEWENELSFLRHDFKEEFNDFILYLNEALRASPECIPDIIYRFHEPHGLCSLIGKKLLGSSDNDVTFNLEDMKSIRKISAHIVAPATISRKEISSSDTPLLPIFIQLNVEVDYLRLQCQLDLQRSAEMAVDLDYNQTRLILLSLPRNFTPSESLLINLYRKSTLLNSCKVDILE